MTGVQLSVYHESTFMADPTLNSVHFVCLSELILSYSVASANFPAAFRRLTKDMRTDFGRAGGFGGTLQYNQYKSSGYLKSQRSVPGEEADTFPMTTIASGARRSKAPDLTGRERSGTAYTWEIGNGDNTRQTSNQVSDYGDEANIIKSKTVTVSHDGRLE